MQHYEYTVVPAPARGEKLRGARTGAERFAHALSIEINRMAQAGWEYVRAETLPCEERSGLTSRTTVYHNVMVFRRALVVGQPERALTASHEAPAAVRSLSSDRIESVRHADPAPDWPVGEPHSQGQSTSQSAAPAAPRAVEVDDNRDPGFNPELPADDNPAPPFTQRPPLAALRAEAAGRDVAAPDPATEVAAASTRLGPAER